MAQVYRCARCHLPLYKVVGHLANGRAMGLDFQRNEITVETVKLTSPLWLAHSPDNYYVCRSCKGQYVVCCDTFAPITFVAIKGEHARADFDARGSTNILPDARLAHVAELNMACPLCNTSYTAA
jgi:hypothetical protein